jgi:hypothetical protein
MDYFPTSFRGFRQFPLPPSPVLTEPAAAAVSAVSAVSATGLEAVGIAASTAALAISAFSAISATRLPLPALARRHPHRVWEVSVFSEPAVPRSRGLWRFRRFPRDDANPWRLKPWSPAGRVQRRLEEVRMMPILWSRRSADISHNIAQERQASFSAFFRKSVIHPAFRARLGSGATLDPHVRHGSV